MILNPWKLLKSASILMPKANIIIKKKFRKSKVQSCRC